MNTHLTILYRGPLESCNYGCEYCPFAKRQETHAQLQGDRDALARFTSWIAGQSSQGNEFSVFFTPWGEALIRSWYQDAIAMLTRQVHVRKVAIQTNISCAIEWLDRCDLNKLGLWCTYHPGETTRRRFLDKCRGLDERGVRYSVGVVGLKEHLSEIEAIRALLQPGVYLWINAYKRVDAYYSDDELKRLVEIDPLFAMNNVRHASFGQPCETGETVFSVDGDGTMRRCHFIKEEIGNIYLDGWKQSLRPRTCTNQTCGCHIGYVHMPGLSLHSVFGDGLLERIPQRSVKSIELPVLA